MEVLLTRGSGFQPSRALGNVVLPERRPDTSWGGHRNGRTATPSTDGSLGGAPILIRLLDGQMTQGSFTGVPLRAGGAATQAVTNSHPPGSMRGRRRGLLSDGVGVRLSLTCEGRGGVYKSKGMGGASGVAAPVSFGRGVGQRRGAYGGTTWWEGCEAQAARGGSGGKEQPWRHAQAVSAHSEGVAAQGSQIGEMVEQYVPIVYGVATLVGLEQGLYTALKLAQLKLSPSGLLLMAIATIMFLRRDVAAKLYEQFEPSLQFFDRWLPMFFVPSIVRISIAPVPAGLDIVRVGFVTVLSYVYALASSSLMVNAIISLLGTSSPPERGSGLAPGLTEGERAERLRQGAAQLVGSTAKALAQASVAKDDRTVRKGALVGARMLERVADKLGRPTPHLQKPVVKPPSPPVLKRLAAGLLWLAPIMMVPVARGNGLLLAPGMLLLTVAAYLQGQSFPKSVRNFLSPTVFAGFVLAVVAATYGTFFFGSWQRGVALYSDGAGLALTTLIGASVASIGFKVHPQRALLLRSIWKFIGAAFLIAPSNMILIALLGRITGLSPAVTLAALPMTTTLGLALGMADVLGANQALVTEGVTACGTLGLNTSRMLLTRFKVADPVARGVAVASSSHALGTSTLMAEEPEAAAIAGLTFATKGAVSTVLVSLPWFRSLLFRIAGAA